MTKESTNGKKEFCLSPFRTRPRKFETVEDIKQAANDYGEFCRENTEYPTVTSFTVFLGLSPSGLKYYSDHDEFKETLTAIKAWIYNGKFQAALRGEIPVALTIFDAINNHGMVNTRSDNNNTTEAKITVDQATVDPVLLDMLTTPGTTTPPDADK